MTTPYNDAVRRGQTSSTVHPERTGPKKINHSFLSLFGWLGAVMVFNFLLATVMLFMQAYTQLYPTEVANLLMNTTEYDSGDFWSLPDPSPTLSVITNALLVGLASGYLSLAMFMICFRRCAHQTQLRMGMHGCFLSLWSTQTHPLSERSRCVNAVMATDQYNPTALRKTSIVSEQAAATTRSALVVAGLDGPYQQWINFGSDLGKLSLQTVMLVTYLTEGFPRTIIAFYLHLLLTNCAISLYRFHQHRVDQRLIKTRLFNLFDLFFAVFSPAFLLAYVMNNFRFDRQLYQTKLDSLGFGNFERIAHIVVDPIEWHLFRTGFSAMIISTPLQLMVKVGLNVFGLIKWTRIIQFLIHSSTTHTEIQQLQIASGELLHQRSSHRVLGSCLLIGFSSAIILYTIVVQVTSTRNCAAYHQCAQISYQWYVSNTDCPCLVYIDRKVDVRTYDEWLHPTNTTSALATLARVGELHTIQIINRLVDPLPAELLQCSRLSHMSLIYTKIQSLPEWAKELTNLTYLHIEGDYTNNGLFEVPHDLFANMKHLKLLHTGGIQKLQQYPSLDNLTNLRSLAIALAYSLTELPNLDHLTNLKILLFADLSHVSRLPSLASLFNLKVFLMVRRNEMCCNGYLDGNCDLSDFQCKQRVGEAVIKCTDDRISTANLQALSQTTQKVVCSRNLTYDLQMNAPTRYSVDTLCGGVMFRKCRMDGQPGICYNSRMQVVNCDFSGLYESMRRLQITRGVGEPCDPTIEAWLGCR